MVKITVVGEKIYDSGESEYTDFDYKVYDSEGYVVDLGTIALENLSQGDRFKEDAIYLRDVIPGEEYRVEFTETEF